MRGNEDREGLKSWVISSLSEGSSNPMAPWNEIDRALRYAFA